MMKNNLAKLKKSLVSPLWALFTVAVLAAVMSSNTSFLESIKLRYFDQLITAKEPTVNNIYTVNIDEAALDKLGQWPPARGEYAQIISELYKRNAGLVVWNILMPEMDRMREDGQLAAIMKQYPVVLNNIPAEVTKNIPKRPGASIINPEFADRIVQYPGIIANTPLLENNAAGVGISNTLPEIDGVNRRLPLVVSVDDQLYPSVSLEVLRIIAGDPSFQIKLSDIGVDKMRVPQFGVIPTDELGRVWIDITQKSKSVSLGDLPKDFQGAVVIVGPTAAGIGNPVPTSAGAIWPHELHAAVIGTMFNKVNIDRPQWAPGLEVLSFIAFGVLLVLLTRWVYVGLISMVALVAVSIGGSYYLFTDHLLLLDGFTSGVGLILVALHAYGIKFVSEFLQKQQIKKQFGTYLSPAMVEKLQKNPELLQLGGEERELSIMFTDVRGFTSISEHYGKDVQGLTKIMNRYMTAMTAKIIENEGTLDKYIGDAQMAFWNAPLDDKQHAKNAVKTGLQMMGSLKGFNDEVTKEGVPPFGMGLGINTATVVVGNMGSDQRFDYTCLGDGVNLASRLEGQSKPYGVKIVLGSLTAEQVKDEYFVLPLDCIAVKGKKEGVDIFTVLGRIDELNIPANDTQMHIAMLDLYRQQKFDTAIKFCKDLMGRFNGEMDHYYEAWIERCEEMKNARLPKDWDGVYRATSK
jgi:adenylate cyclase